MALENLWELVLENLRNGDSHHLKSSWIIDSCQCSQKMAIQLTSGCCCHSLSAAPLCVSPSQVSLSPFLWRYRAAATVSERAESNNTSHFFMRWNHSVDNNLLLETKVNQFSPIFRFSILKLSWLKFVQFFLKIYNFYLHPYNWHVK